MEKDVLLLIEEHYNSFSKGQREIAKFITQNYDKAAFMNAVKLGTTVGVSESTVVRFAFLLGYDGYPGMRRALQEMIRNRLTSVQRIEVAKDIINTGDVLSNVLSSDVDKIRTTLDAIDKDAFEAAVDKLLGAKQIYVLGLRAAAILSGFMGFYLSLTNENVKSVSDTYANEAFEQIINIGKGDVLFAISFPRYSRRTIRAINYAKAQGATIIGLTDGVASPIAELSDIKIFAKSDMVSYLDSLVAPLSVVNAILVAMAHKAEDKVSERFAKLEQIWSEYDVFASSD